MADSTLNRFLSAGTAAARAAFTPTPPSPAAGAAQGYFWHETDTGDTYSWKAGTGWVKVNTGTINAASTTEVLTGTDSTKAVTADSLAAIWEQGADVASAGTTSLGEGGYFNITGTTTITDIDFATDKAGRHAWVKFAGILTLTHNASTLILPTGANITTAAGDTACFVSEGSDVVRCVAYQRGGSAGGYFCQRVWATQGAAVTLNVNSTTYVSNSSLIVTIDLTEFPATHYRINVNGQANAVGQTIKMQLATTFGSPTTPVHTGGDDVTVNNAFGAYNSGWLTRDVAPGAEGYIIVMKGSNSTVDANMNFIDIEWRY